MVSLNKSSPLMTQTNKSNYKWYILTLTVATYASVMAMRMCFPVLFKEMSQDLGLSLISVGAIWGMDPLAGAFVSLPAGLIADRFGVKRTLTVVCLLQGVFGVLRGLSSNFASMAASMFLFGVVAAMAPTLMSKVTAVWFRGQSLGLTQALIMIGGGVGSIAGTMFGATVFSPLLGGWRHVLFLYSVPPIIMGLLWLVTGREPKESESPAAASSVVPFRQSLSQVIRIKRIWLIGLAQMCQYGALAGLTGYLALYLRTIGWSPASADGALTILTGISCIGALPIVLLSYRLGSQKRMLTLIIIITAVTLGLMPLASGPAVWAILAINGFLRTGTTTLFITMVLETEGVGATYAGAALGLQNTLSMLGGFLSPPLGNSLASINPGSPLIFWAVMSAAALPWLHFLRDKDREKQGAI
jgi:NNP family nitrate/nitrite transporter-like MFS transporter